MKREYQDYLADVNEMINTILEFTHIWPVVSTLLTVDAPQFDHIALNHALCWIHAGRSLKKLNPISPAFQEILQMKINEFWEYYNWLTEFKQNPLSEHINDFEKIFDEIFHIKPVTKF